MTRPLALLCTCALLAGCGEMPDFRAGERFGAFIARPLAPGSTPAIPAAPQGPAASAAETACTDAGRAAGFTVQGVVGTREVLPPAGGAPVSRDVVLRVARGGQTLEVRCNYAYATSTARMMTL